MSAAAHRHPRAARIGELARGVGREQSAEQVGLAASGAAFWLFLSAFPTSVAVVSVFGLVVRPGRVASDLSQLSAALPPSLGALVTDQLRRVAASDHSGLSVGLAVSVVVAVWSASAGVFNLDRAIREAYGLPRQGYLAAKRRAFAGAFSVVLALGGAALLTSAALTHTPAGLAVVLGVPAAYVGVTAAIVAMYRLSVGRTAAVRTLLPGACVSAVGVMILVAAFGTFVGLSGHYTVEYGAFAGAVTGMVGTYLAVYAVLLGAVLNSQLLSRQVPNSQPSGSKGPRPI